MPNKCTMHVVKNRETNWLTVEELFSGLYERYYGKTLDQAAFYCGSRELAEDVVQDVFMRVWERLNEFRQKINDWNTWHSFLFVLVRNRASNLKSRRNTQIALFDSYSMWASEVMYHDPVLEKECYRILTEGIDQLGNQQKEIYILKYYRYSSNVIAKEMKLGSSTVRNTLIKARKKLYDHAQREFKIDEQKLVCPD